MKLRFATSAVVTLVLAAAGTAFADHNSKNGEGWANMPNDIHNTRIETKEANDNEAFRDFVKYGDGSRTQNRFATDSNTPAQAGDKQNLAQKKEKKQEQKQVESRPANQARFENQANSRTENRSRQRLDSRSTSRSSLASGTRSSGARRGGRGK